MIKCLVSKENKGNILMHNTPYLLKGKKLICISKIKMKNIKLPHCRNNSKNKYQNSRNRQNIYPFFPGLVLSLL